MFKNYVFLGNNFDPKVADLYSDDGFIQNTRIYPNRLQRVVTLPAREYKNLIRATISITKLREDLNTFRNVKYTVEGENVLINADRYSHSKNYTSPISLLVGPSDSQSNWVIKEEIGQTRPQKCIMEETISWTWKEYP